MSPNDSPSPTDVPRPPESTSVLWTSLRARLDQAGQLGAIVKGPSVEPNALTIDHLSSDSRRVRPGGLFAAIRGTASDGHTFIDNAIQNGARVVLCETVPSEARTRHPRVLFVRVPDSRVALAELAAAFYGDPADALRMVGVTGTNGKTTVAYLTNHMLDALGETTGLISTIEVRTGTMATNASLTTPGPVALHRTLRHMVDEQCSACTMEVSSHALDQRRVHGVDYEVGIFTNLTTEHLDYHETLANYRTAKKRLFDGLSSDAVAVVNGDDPEHEAMIEDTRASVLTFGFGSEVDVRGEILESRLDGLRLRLDGQEASFRLAGRFNAFNLAAAYGVGRAMGFAASDVMDALSTAPPVPGRFEQMTFGDGRTVIVDYAHTPDALENVLTAIRSLKPDDATLWCVFGCGGDRDTSKRRTMGTIAEHYADRVIVTSDNPRTEEPDAILSDVRRGMSRPARAAWIVDREEAIRAAANESAPGDVVLIAGKGHETYQVIGTQRRPFDDRKVARRYFEQSDT